MVQMLLIPESICVMKSWQTKTLKVMEMCQEIRLETLKMFLRERARARERVFDVDSNEAQRNINKKTLSLPF